MELTLAPLPENNTVFEVEIDGKSSAARHVRISSRFGTFQLGLRPEGFGGWVFREPEGGGAITIPYAIDHMTGKVFVGMIHEHRPNLGPEPVWCAIGGIVDPGESRQETQEREAREESGLDTSAAYKLDGLPFVQDRLYYVADPHEGEGNETFALRLEYGELVRADKGLKLPEERFGVKHESELRFFPVRMAITLSADAAMLAGIARLLVALERI